MCALISRKRETIMNKVRDYLMQFTQLYGPIAFTSRDVDYLLDGDVEVDAIEYVTTSPDYRMVNLLDDVTGLLLDKYLKAAFILTCNRDMQPALTMEDMVPFVNFVNTQPTGSDILWAYLYDDSLPTNTLKLTVIVIRDEC